MEPRKVDAIRALGYNVNQNGDDLDYLGKTPPSESDIDTKYASMIADWDAQEYARDRQPEYPSIPDQLDKIYHSGINEWKKDIKAVKDKYPKP